MLVSRSLRPAVSNLVSASVIATTSTFPSHPALACNSCVSAAPALAICSTTLYRNTISIGNYTRVCRLFSQSATHGYSTQSDADPAQARLSTPNRTRRSKNFKITTVRLSDLPQGLLPSAEPEIPPTPPDSTIRDNVKPSLEEAGRPSMGCKPSSNCPTSLTSPPTYPTVVQQARTNMDRFIGCVLLTRVGGFYELYFEQAEELGPLLNLKVAQKKTSAGPVSMAGFPFFQLDRFLKVLVQDLERHVAVAEEFPNTDSARLKAGGLLHDRKVSRVITPGTLIDETFIDPYANNYIMSIHLIDRSSANPIASPPPSQHPAVSPEPLVPTLGLAWLDLSTGHFFTQNTDPTALPTVLARVSPREIVLDRYFQSRPGHHIVSVLAEERYLVTYASSTRLASIADWTPMLESEVPADLQTAFSNAEIAAGNLLLEYVQSRLHDQHMSLQLPLRFEDLQIMAIDKNSMRSLEIKRTIRDAAFRGSLLHAIGRTCTQSGTRLLSQWLCSPSTSIQLIQSRHNLVAHFVHDKDLRDSIMLLLRRSHDSQRLVQKFALGRGDPDDLLALAQTILATDEIATLLHGINGGSSSDAVSSLVARISLPEPLLLAKQIRDAIDEDGVVSQHEMEVAVTQRMLSIASEAVASEAGGSSESAEAFLPKTTTLTKRSKPASLKLYYSNETDAWILKPDVSPTLRSLHDQLETLFHEKEVLGVSLRDSLGTPTLTLRWTPALGHICHVKGRDISAVAGAKSISASRSTRSFQRPEWTHLGHRLDQARVRIRAEEQRLLQRLRERVVANLVKLRRNAAVLDELDVTTSFARLAVERSLVRPVLTNSTAHHVINGRHPTVEGGLLEQGRTFTGNDCLVGAPGHGRLWLITGPNMAGKSTFLRQNALIIILAQVGCYVPADYAQLGIVDAIFSRIGSADDLYRDQSTFMVEMLETAQILRRATPRSFVTMDEIGRGTTPSDGAAIAFAALHHLVTVNRCRALFATHFHTVVDLATAWRLPVDTYCTDLREDRRGGFVYVHKLRSGVNRSSHALKVAQLAGLPAEALKIAGRVLNSADTSVGITVAATVAASVAEKPRALNLGFLDGKPMPRTASAGA